MKVKLKEVSHTVGYDNYTDLVPHFLIRLKDN